MDLGRANWMYDEELDMHIPCCSKWLYVDDYRLLSADPETGDLKFIGDPVTKIVGRCENGPLTGNQILTGDCGEPHSRDFRPSV